MLALRRICPSSRSKGTAISASPVLIRWLALTGVVLSVLCALCLGRFPLSPQRVLGVFGYFLHLSSTDDPVARTVVMQARLPRILAALLVGSALSCGGASYQAVFRNPLVSPDLLGVLSGAAFGAAVAIILGGAVSVVQGGAFAGGLLAVGCGLLIGRSLPEGGILSLLLGGLIGNAIFTALLSLVKYLADPMDQLPAIVDWLLGSLAPSGWQELAWVSGPLIGLTAALVLCAPVLDVLSLGDDEARSLGVSVRVMRPMVIVLATFACALTISMAGIIGWIGLLVPHVARLVAGAEHRNMMPVCALLGAAGLVLADTCARSLTAGEVPLGIVTQLFGALAFIIVLRRLRRGVG
ncbi:FecCD family ABC transporter permease [Gluconobacter kanchanaburiensis]|uniref:Iron ABC transporter permease n=1 Tax=Gluconobacter kanchanaburiensis NBRC 103587 TaxID=1307948 RepID=A0A511B6K0_9PROT|nr:iron ABC transporter permease [Gluconobacter kanchanaburiensis]MBF0861626.1 iron ABC transporter permease [Gluconobacter kanchanaburiensis]GBR67115.1 Fe3+-siderophore ABC transporter permease [Gluconobacter kanchanaburiensis NBRC 103587]GEK95271.1 iron ABC transporter permease [Gluconobacter kanchanaburiensis NBRC 103587]